MIPNLSEIIEGTTKLLVPSEEKLLKKNPVFYNPEMEFSRDLSVAVVRVLKPEKFCDLLSGSGARGVRIANETETGKVIVNDVNPSAYELIKKNISLNNIPDSRIRAVNDYAQNVLSRETFDFIDVDPFGPPVQFMDCALRSIKNNGTLAVTATDTAALCGTYPKACRRKYDSLSLRAEYFNELGLRILIGFVARNSLKYNIGITPLFSHCTRHYFRAYLKVQLGNKYVNENLRNIRYIQHCFSCLERSYRSLDNLDEKCVCGERLATAGPVWAGNFSDTEFCENLHNETETGVFNTKKKALKIISQIKEEQEVQIPYYDVHKICKKLKIHSPGMEELTGKFRENNFKISRTHFSGTGIRTDAGIDKIKEMVSS
jgi:tRNA (guanine26-N2/guanine27-N2)-dimethyltransferase